MITTDKLHIDQIINDGTEGVASGDTLVIQYDDSVRFLGLEALCSFSIKHNQQFAYDDLFDWYVSRPNKFVMHEAYLLKQIEVSRDIYDYFLLSNIDSKKLVTSEECPIFLSAYTLLKNRTIRKVYIYTETPTITEFCKVDLECSSVSNISNDFEIVEKLDNIVDIAGTNGASYICDISTGMELAKRCHNVAHIGINGMFKYNVKDDGTFHKVKMRNPYSTFAYLVNNEMVGKIDESNEHIPDK